jgi:acetolactate synthase-1/2/3 large subunit
VKLSEYVAQVVANISPRVYGVCGAGAMHLNDAIANHPGIKVISMQHEQAAAMAAEADARVTGNISVVSVTAGPGGTNAITGVATSYVDSIPMLIIAGQVTTSTMIGNSGTRQVGMNELDMVALMKPITKYAATVTDPLSISSVLGRAIYLATHGRKGPVFIEIPLDVQAAEIDPAELEVFLPAELSVPNDEQYINGKVSEVLSALADAKKPVVIVGNGVRLAGACEEFRRVFYHLGIPIVSSWGATDIVPTEHPYYIGRCGLFGDRASNFAVQGADLILAIGTRLSVAQIGHAPQLFAPNAKKIIVDIDKYEVFHKQTIKADIGVIADAKDFLSRMWPRAQLTSQYEKWLKHCQAMKGKYPAAWFAPTSGISSYGFIEQLSDQIDIDAIVVTDVGFCFIPTMQTLKLKLGQRLIHSAGVSPMGWGLPGAIGAAFAGGGRPVICLTGDGGAMMNLQELQTIANHRLPIAIFVFENDGYATMKIAQKNHFKREVMSGPRSGMILPDFTKIAKAFGIYTMEFNSQNLLAHSMSNIFDISSQGPIMIVMHMEPEEIISPRVQAKTENGKFLPTDIANLWPYLPKKEFDQNMSHKTEKGFADVVERLDELGQKTLGTN